MRKRFLLLVFIFLSVIGLTQNTSPLVIKDFVQKSNEIIDLEQIPKFNRTDLDSNPICRIKVKSVGFSEDVLQKFIFVPKGIEITHMVFKEGQWFLHVSSHKNGEITIKYMGDCVFRLPYQLEPGKVYELSLGMETATLVIKTVPVYADIFVDNEKVGTGEAIKPVSLGVEHRYRVVCDDYYTKEGVVQFVKQEEKTINVELEPNFGYITINTEPSGADVYIDKTMVGRTPYLIEKIARGQHRIEIRKTGYSPYTELVTIKTGDHNKTLEKVTLEADENYTPPTIVTSAPQTYTSSGKISVKDIAFANVDYDNNIIEDFGSKLLASQLIYLRARLTYDCLDTNLKNADFAVKIIKPDGTLETGSSSPEGYTQVMNRDISYGYGKYLYMIGWGNKNGGVYKPGDYTYEVWYDGERIASKSFTIYDDIVIKDITFANTDYDNNIIDDFGSKLHKSTIRYLRPKVTYDCLKKDMTSVEISTKIIDPHGDLERGTSSPEGYTQTMNRSISYGKDKTVYLISWGNRNGNAYYYGIYTYEIWYQGRKLYSKQFIIY